MAFIQIPGLQTCVPPPVHVYVNFFLEQAFDVQASIYPGVGSRGPTAACNGFWQRPIMPIVYTLQSV
ncbi:hypothetical protein N7520_002811 [Penicillium odoratum]|uniref:uncharacterized protein n=1 Tax=Penicillium odoratum TaxID=1167516 RepID=UPI002546658C|nr:uncharacterized protein N7520_002811 [Penicillium odoratum]KAJ5772282.1 hypothetical protein N7520_002811 [Penicillium odoratum]